MAGPRLAGLRLRPAPANRSHPRPPAWLPLLLAVVLLGLCAWLGRHVGPAGAYLRLGPAVPLSGHLDVRLSARVWLPVIVGLVLLVALPWLADRLPWRALLLAMPVASAAWAVSLALVDGEAGLTRTIGSDPEYLSQVDRVGPLRQFLSTYTDHILFHSPGFSWHTHAAGHPPGALLTFALLDRAGFGGVRWAAAWDIAWGVSAVAAALVVTRLLAGEGVGRRAAPFLGTAVAVLWVATSADAYFLGISAWGIALLALAGERRSVVGDVLALLGGLLLGWSIYCSYGLVLLAPVVLVIALARRRIRPLLVGGAGVAAVVVAFLAGGFWWAHGIAVLHERYYAGVAADRPYWYFLFADVAVLALVVGPAGLVALTRLRRSALAWLPAGALLGLLVADVSGLATGEVERIWLPWTPWLLVATAVLPVEHRRRWLAAQLVVALALEVCVKTNW